MAYDSLGRNTNYVDTAKEFRDTASRAAMGDKASTEILAGWIHAEQKLGDWNAVATAIEKQAPGSVQRDASGSITGLVFATENHALHVAIDKTKHISINGRNEKQIAADDVQYLERVNEGRLDPGLPANVRTTVEAIENGLFHHSSQEVAAAAKSIGMNDALGAQVASQLNQDLLPSAEVAWKKDPNGVGQLVIDQIQPMQQFAFGTDGSITNPTLSASKLSSSTLGGFEDHPQTIQGAVAGVGEDFRSTLMFGTDDRHTRYLGSATEGDPLKLGQLLRTTL